MNQKNLLQTLLCKICQPPTKKLAIGGLNSFVSAEVQNSTFVLRLKFSAKNPTHRQFSKRCVLYFVLTKIRSSDELILSAEAKQKK